MSVATAEKSQSSNRDIEAVKAKLRTQFECQLDRASEATLLAIAKMNAAKAFAVLAKNEADDRRSAETRSQAARARMIAKAFDRVKDRCELLEASEVATILGMSKQALSQRMKAGQVLAYTHNRRKYFPAFQFAENKIKPVIGQLMKELAVDPADISAVNFLVQHLVSRMDFSNAGETSNVVQRFELLDNNAALEIIKRDYINAFEMGQ